MENKILEILNKTTFVDFDSKLKVVFNSIKKMIEALQHEGIGIKADKQILDNNRAIYLYINENLKRIKILERKKIRTLKEQERQKEMEKKEIEKKNLDSKIKKGENN